MSRKYLTILLILMIIGACEIKRPFYVSYKTSSTTSSSTSTTTTTATSSTSLGTWTRLLGTGTSDNGGGITISPDGAYVYVTGNTKGNLDDNTNNGRDDIFIAKYSIEGTKQWVKLLGSGDNEEGKSITTDGTYLYITGDTWGNLDGNTNNGYSDIFIAKYSIEGTKQWVKLLGSIYFDAASDITISPGGDYIYITGDAGGNLDDNTNNGYSDILIAKYDSNGNNLWVTLLGTGTYDYGSGITISPDGDYIYITGQTKGDLDGNANNGSADIFIAKYSIEGTKQWVKLLGSVTSDYSSSITTDGNYLYITGYTWGNLDSNTNNGSADIFIAKYSIEGTKQWVKLLGSVTSDYSSSITTDGNYLYITGYTWGNLDGNINNGGGDIFIAKYSIEGTKQWVKLLGTEYYDTANNITISPGGDYVYITGNTGGNLNGNTNNGSNDIFIHKDVTSP